jgi:paired amphipathic helix protein Sin3a
MDPPRPDDATSGAPSHKLDFNRALSYVEHIKTRFPSDPEVYERFLEILQSYKKSVTSIEGMSRLVFVM